MVFQQGSAIWTGALDLETGLFVSATGADAFVDVASSLVVARNGPEYGWDADGVAIFYNRSVLRGAERIWRATPDSTGSFDAVPISPPGLDRVNQLPSQWSDAPSTWVVYARESLLQPPGTIASADEAAPNVELDVTPVVPGFAGFRWLRGSSLYTVTEAEGPNAGQVVLVDAATGLERVVTNDPGIKFDPYPWRAPEFSDRICVAAVVDDSDIAVYLDNGGTFFQRISTLAPPAETQLGVARSPEPFVSGQRSLISLTLADVAGSFYEEVGESEIWVYGILDGPGRFARRFDDGEPGQVRHEAETLSGPNEVFLYYNRRQPAGPGGLAGFDLYRVKY